MTTLVAVSEVGQIYSTEFPLCSLNEVSRLPQRIKVDFNYRKIVGDLANGCNYFQLSEEIGSNGE